MRLKRIDVTWDLIEVLFENREISPMGELLEMKDALPAGARLHSVQVASSRRILELRFTHESFDDVPEGEEIPILVPTITREIGERVRRLD